MISQDQLNDILDQHPDLSAFGFRVPEETNTVANRKRLYVSLDEVNISIRYLTECLKHKGEKESRNSYGLKHAAEKYRGPGYVSNGALIVAVIHLGLDFERDEPNVYLNIYVPEKLQWNALRRTYALRMSTE